MHFKVKETVAEEDLQNSEKTQNIKEISSEYWSKTLSKTNTMILKAFYYIETMVFGFFNMLWTFSGNSVVKTIALVAFGVFYEIFIYTILGIACFFINVILQTHEIITENNKKKLKGSIDQGGDKYADFLIDELNK